MSAPPTATPQLKKGIVKQVSTLTKFYQNLSIENSFFFVVSYVRSPSSHHIHNILDIWGVKKKDSCNYFLPDLSMTI